MPKKKFRRIAGEADMVAAYRFLEKRVEDLEDGVEKIAHAPAIESDVSLADMQAAVPHKPTSKKKASKKKASSKKKTRKRKAA